MFKLWCLCAGLMLAFPFLSGCRLIGLDAEHKFGITAQEVREKSQRAADPHGVMKKAVSFEMVQKVTESGRNLLGKATTKTHTEITRYKSPFYLCIMEVYNPETIKRLIANPRGIWDIDIVGHVTEITQSRQKEAFEFSMAEMNPQTTDDMLWKSMVLEESDIRPDSWYKLVMYPKTKAIVKKTFYIEKNTFLPRRVEVDLGSAVSTTEIIEYKAYPNGLKMVQVAKSSYSDARFGGKVTRELKAFRLNTLDADCDCDFEPETPAGMTLPGCKACGPNSKPRSVYHEQ